MLKFNNCLVYHFKSESDLAPLSNLPIADENGEPIPVFNSDADGFGYIPGPENTDMLFHPYGDISIARFALRRTTAPAVLVRNAIEQRRQRLEQKGIELNRKEWAHEKAEIHADVKRKFPKVQIWTAWVALQPKYGLLFVGTTSRSFAEDILAEFRSVLGTLPVLPLSARIDGSRLSENILRAMIDDYSHPEADFGDNNRVTGWVEASDNNGNKVRRNSPEALNESLSDDVAGLGYEPNKVQIEALHPYEALNPPVLEYVFNLDTCGVHKIVWVDDEGRDNLSAEASGEKLAFATAYAIVSLLSNSLRSLMAHYPVK